MSPEEMLAALLREEGETIVPAGDGLQKIQKRVAAKRRTRWVLPGALVATAAAASFAFFLNDTDDRSSLQQVPGGTPTATETNEPSPTPTQAGGGLDHPLENPAVWPFTTSQEIADWKSTNPYANDKTAVVQHYLKDILSLDGTFALTKPCESCDVVDIALGARKVGQAALERFTLDGEQVYTISDIGGNDLTLTSPTPGEGISSPTKVTGRITGVDESVRITLTDGQGGQLGSVSAPAGSEVPWEGSVSWDATGWVHGAVVLTTFSAKDGTLNRLTVVPVTRGDGPATTTTGPTFAGVRSGRVDLFRSDTGAFVKHLTFPPAGASDTDATYAGGRLVWLRTGGGACAQSLGQIDGGKASVVVPTGFKLQTPRLSPDGRTLAYWREPCTGGGAGTVVVVGPSGTRELDAAKKEPFVVHDVADDGRLLLGAVFGHGGVVLVKAGAATLDDSTALPSTYPCELGSSAFADDHVIAWEQCDTYDNKLVTFDASGHRQSAGKDTSVQFVQRTSVVDGTVLVSGSGRDDSPAEVYALERGELRLLLEGVTSASW